MENITFKCKFCEKVFGSKQALGSHTGKCKQNPNATNAEPSEKWYASMKHRKKPGPLSEEHRKKLSEALRGKGHLMSEDTKKKISETCKKNKLSGGYRKGSGRGKKGTYKGYYCDSSWELAYVIYNLDHNIKFERNEELFPYEFNGEQHNYKPDFIENGVYVEIKGYFTEQVKAKENAFPFQLKYLDINGIKPYIDYVEKTYGKDFIRLYE